MRSDPAALDLVIRGMSSRMTVFIITFSAFSSDNRWQSWHRPNHCASRTESLSPMVYISAQPASYCRSEPTITLARTMNYKREANGELGGDVGDIR
jgi:hypothetical protein